MTTQDECDYQDKLTAARAMLAALEGFMDLQPYSGFSVVAPVVVNIRQAIALAKAAGITAKG